MTLEQPPRLKHSDEFGPLLRAADVEVSPERLAANAAGVKNLIATGATTFALWKLIVPFLLLLAVLVPLIVKLGSSGGGDGQPARETPAPQIAAAPTPDAAVLAVVPPSDAAEPVIEADAATIARKPAPARVATVDAAVEISPTSDLPEQIRIYEAARAAGQRGELDRGLALIAELTSRFPATPLRAEAELTRAELLARGNRVGEAAPAIEILVADPVHRGRKGELLRTLGDLYRRNGDCPRAVEAYTRALAERLADRDRADIERGRSRCAAETAR